ncbi:MAG TPA: hypothetical protein VJC12_01645 [Candidatus Paceibacterota bacterium]
MLPIAIGGSAANPAILAHRELIGWLLNSGKFSKVIWIISGQRNDKKNLIDPEHRLIITLLTIPTEWFLKKDVDFTISFEDLYKQNTPTIEWLERYKGIYPDNEVIWFTGADSIVKREEFSGLNEIQARWVRGEELFKKWKFLIFPREGYKDPSELMLPENFEIAQVKLKGASSSEVRNRIANGEPFEKFMAKEATEYIKLKKLYGFN